MSKKIMTEEIPMEDFSRDNDADEDEETDTITSTSEFPAWDYYQPELDERGQPVEGEGPDNFRDEEYDRRVEAGQYLKRYFPDFNPMDASFNVKFEEDGSITGVLSDRKDAKKHIILDKDKNLRVEDLPKVMRKELGADYETMAEKYNNTASELKQSNEKIKELDNALQGLKATAEVYPLEIERYAEREKELREFIERQQVQKAKTKSLFDQTVKQNIELKIQAEKLLDEVKLYKEEIDKYKKGKSNLSKLEQSNERLKSENDKLREQIRNKAISNVEQLSEIQARKDEILKNLPLRERLKYIFKKYGFTVFAVLSAVGAIIGVIVSNLSKGLSALGKGVSNGLKTLGKKLGEILPGMVGAIVSFLFKTAGQVIGFLGENAWLLIMAVVLYFVEQMKGEKKRK